VSSKTTDGAQRFPHWLLENRRPPAIVGRVLARENELRVMARVVLAGSAVAADAQLSGST